jgi:uncharacterized repeat protein (TIGR03899 family)
MDVNDLLGLGQSLDKLLSVIENGVGKLYEPTHLKNIAKAKSVEVKLIEAAKTEAEIARAKQLSKLQPDVVLSLPNVSIDLIERAKFRLARQEIERQFNIDNIVEQAVLALPNSTNGEPVGHDWTHRFFQAAQDISEHEMHKIWGKVLAGETAKPGNFSLRTLDILRNLSSREANIFSIACSLSTDDNSLIFKPPGNSLLEYDEYSFVDFGLSFDEKITLIDAGLILPNDLGFKLESHSTINFFGHGKSFTLKNINPQPISASNTLSIISFTEAGRQLGKLVDCNINSAYFEFLKSRLAIHQISLTY